MRLHLVAFPHTRVTPEFCGCAYTAKVHKALKMWAHHDVTLYAPEGSDARGHDLVECLTDTERIDQFGPDDASRLPAWPTDEQWRLFNTRAILGILERAEPHDLILLTAGWSQRAIKDALPHLTACEPGVGYEGILTDRCAFESHAWRHHVYGLKGIRDGRWYDAVIPNYFDADDFPIANHGDGDYLLYVGRIIQRKGVHVAAEIAKAVGLPLKVAGAGVLEHEPGRIVAAEVTVEAPGLDYVGTVNVAERAELMAGAVCLLAPTVYLEPFGGVAVEAMMAGTPVVATDWGAFTETVVEGESGYRFQTLAQGVDAVARAAALDNDRVRAFAESRYSLDAVAPQFDRWFHQLDDLWRDGWYELPGKGAGNRVTVVPSA